MEIELTLLCEFGLTGSFGLCCYFVGLVLGFLDPREERTSYGKVEKQGKT